MLLLKNDYNIDLEWNSIGNYNPCCVNSNIIEKTKNNCNFWTYFFIFIYYYFFNLHNYKKHCRSEKEKKNKRHNKRHF